MQIFDAMQEARFKAIRDNASLLRWEINPAAFDNLRMDPRFRDWPNEPDRLAERQLLGIPVCLITDGKTTPTWQLVVERIDG